MQLSSITSLVKSANIEKKPLPYKTPMPEANVNYTWTEKTQKRLIYYDENIILAASGYIIV